MISWGHILFFLSSWLHFLRCGLMSPPVIQVQNTVFLEKCRFPGQTPPQATESAVPSSPGGPLQEGALWLEGRVRWHPARLLRCRAWPVPVGEAFEPALCLTGWLLQAWAGAPGRWHCWLVGNAGVLLVRTLVTSVHSPEKVDWLIMWSVHQMALSED